MVSNNQPGFFELCTNRSESRELDLFNSPRHEGRQKKDGITAVYPQCRLGCTVYGALRSFGEDIFNHSPLSIFYA